MNRSVVNPPSLFNSLQYGFSQAVVVDGGRRVHLSGQVSVDEQERLTGRTLAEQTEAAVDNIETLLKSLGGGLEHVVMLRIYIVESERANQAAVSRALLNRFPVNPPASTWLLVSGLSEPEWLVEVEAEAVLP